MNINKDNRQTLRKKNRLNRKNLSITFQQQASTQLVQQLANHQQLKQAKHIAIYLANDGEVDPMPFIHWCWQQQIKTYLPVIHPFSSGHLLFLHYHQTSEMVTNKYGILEPVLAVRDVLPVTQIDVIFTPLVAFDLTGARLGMGGGYYDRTLAKTPSNALSQCKPYPIGLAHDCQLVDHIPNEDWDIPLPEIVTPTKHYQFF